MNDDVDQLTSLILSTAGRKEAIAVYEEETGCSHAESVRAVDKLSHAVGGRSKANFGKRIGLFAVALLAGSVALLVTLL